MEREEIRQITEDVVRIATTSLRDEHRVRLDEVAGEFRREISDFVKQATDNHVATTVKLSTTAELLATCVGKIEQLYTRVFVGNGSASIVAELAHIRSENENHKSIIAGQSSRISKLEEHNTWLIRGLVSAILTTILAAAGWVISYLAK